MRAGRQLSEAPTGEGTWTAQRLRAYLVEMSYNTWQEDLCLAPRDFPKRIRLDRHFQEPFAMMRGETDRDQRERWRFIGITKDRNRIKLSLPVVLTDNQRMMRDDMLYTQWLAEQNGIPNVVGDVQTRPSERDSQTPRATIT